jgi:hypothetical protein
MVHLNRQHFVLYLFGLLNAKVTLVIDNLLSRAYIKEKLLGDVS